MGIWWQVAVPSRERGRFGWQRLAGDPPAIQHAPPTGDFTIELRARLHADGCMVGDLLAEERLCLAVAASATDLARGEGLRGLPLPLHCQNDNFLQ